MLVGTKDREKIVLANISEASNSVQALRILEKFAKKTATLSQRSYRMDIHAGSLMLTSNILRKMQQMLQEQGFELETIYTTVPQTQQAALDVGFFVKEVPQMDQDFAKEGFITAKNLKTVDTFMEEILRDPRESTEEPVEEPVEGGYTNTTRSD